MSLLSLNRILQRAGGSADAPSSYPRFWSTLSLPDTGQSRLLPDFDATLDRGCFVDLKGGVCYGRRMACYWRKDREPTNGF